MHVNNYEKYLEQLQWLGFVAAGFVGAGCVDYERESENNMHEMQRRDVAKTVQRLVCQGTGLEDFVFVLKKSLLIKTRTETNHATIATAERPKRE